MKRMRRSSRFVARTISDQTILLPLLPGEEGKWLYEFNESAAYLWDQMTGNFTEAELVVKLTSRFAIDSEAGTEDVRAVLTDLKNLGAIE